MRTLILIEIHILCLVTTVPILKVCHYDIVLNHNIYSPLEEITIVLHPILYHLTDSSISKKKGVIRVSTHSYHDSVIKTSIFLPMK